MKIHKIQDFKGKFFEILETTPGSQVAVMTIPQGGDSGPEDIHKGDQIVYVIEGEGEFELEHEKVKVAAGELLIIPAGSQHHIYNTGSADLFFVSLYAPPSY